MKAKKPLGHKNYGSIPHLPGSGRGLGDHSCHEGQIKIATEKRRAGLDVIIVQEKLDGSNVGVARIKDKLIPLGRAGYPAITSRWEQHKHFHNWVYSNYERFMGVLENGERLVGEWLMQAHGTRYDLTGREPFVPFDIMVGHERMLYGEFIERMDNVFIIPYTIRIGGSLSIEAAMRALNPEIIPGTALEASRRTLPSDYGFHGALEPVEGAVWRVESGKPTGKKGEKRWYVNFLVKYVRPDKEDGKYLPEFSGEEAVWNWMPDR